MEYHIICSRNKNNIIGIQDRLFIECKEDLSYFYKITTMKYPEGMNNVIIMGYNTWKSIPENVRPFKNRYSIILTKKHKIENTENCISMDSLESAFEYISEYKISLQLGRIFVIGGGKVFEECKYKYMNNLVSLYITDFENYYSNKYNQYIYFPIRLFTDTIIYPISKKQSSNCLINIFNEESKSVNLSYTFNKYIKKNKINLEEYQYLELLKDILDNGNQIQSRNSEVLSLFGEKMTFDLQKGFPLLTTKKMGYKTILRELLWFLKGSTNNEELQFKNVHIWDQNASKEFLESCNLNYEEGDLGPIYGFQWRHFGAEYKDRYTNYDGKGIDQIKQIIQQIKEDPHSRRILLSAWNPADLHKMALPPCHVMCQFYVNKTLNTLDCQLYQRSGDMFLGVPYNIASYSFLTHIIAKLTGYKAGKLIHILGDAHIYINHINAVEKQLERVPIKFPEIEISDTLIDIDTIHENMITINNYQSYERIQADMIA